jgi:membrane-associated protease RseP (regulator of RpoE activity)
LLLAVPCAFIGIMLSKAVKTAGAAHSFVELGDPLLFRLLQWLIVKNLPPGYELLLHPVGYAAWVGLFVTSLNLLPIGQLDGGHVAYAVFGNRAKWVFWALIPMLVLLAIFYSAGWLSVPFCS